MIVHDVLAGTPARASDPALYDGIETFSYGEVERLVDDRVVELRDAGVEPGGYHPLLVTTSRTSIVELLAVWRIGAVPVPVNPSLTAPERDEIRRAIAGTRPPQSTQVVLWTSGSSGQARGVALGWEGMKSITHAIADRLHLSSNDRWLCTLSPAHVGGLMAIVRGILLGGTLIALGPVRLDMISAMLDGAMPSRTGEGRLAAPTRVSFVPVQLQRVLEMREGLPAPPALRSVLVGGAHTPTSLIDRALELGWPIALTYGTTETSSQVATAPPKLTRALRGTVGQPLDGVEVRIADDGEILVRGPSVARYRVGAETEPITDDEGWYHTGDLGDLNDYGQLWITGRRIDRIVTGGVTVEATEVEEALRSDPTVLDACVVGVPDEKWGESVGAWIEPVEGEFDPAALEDAMSERLTTSKRPRIWHVSGGIPRNANGKVDRDAVRSVLESAARRGGD